MNWRKSFLRPPGGRFFSSPAFLETGVLYFLVICTNLSHKCIVSKKGSPGEIWTGFRSSRFQIFFKIGVLKNFANSVKFANFLKTPFFTEQLQWLLLTFNLYFQMSSERKLMRLSAINTIFSWKKYFLSRKWAPQWERI